MKRLSIDSAGKTAAVAVSEGEVILARGFADAGLTHSQMLLPLVDDTLKKAGVPLGEIGEFAVTCGPGSFTGLRIGCALVKGMALERPCIPVPTLMALAFNERNAGRVAVALLDARCRQVYMAGYAFEGGAPSERISQRACSVEEAKELITALEEPVVLLGDGAYLLEELADGERIVLSEQNNILGEGVAAAASFVEPIPSERLIPSYFRLSQAERERMEREKKEKGE